MLDLIEIKKAQIIFCKKFSIYYSSKEREPVLYKPVEKRLDAATIEKNPELLKALTTINEGQNINDTICNLVFMISNKPKSKALKSRTTLVIANPFQNTKFPQDYP